MAKTSLPKGTSEGISSSAEGRVRYIVHPTPPNAAGKRKLCAHVVAQKTYAMEEFAEAVAQDHRLLDAETVFHVLQCSHEMMAHALQLFSGRSCRSYFQVRIKLPRVGRDDFCVVILSYFQTKFRFPDTCRAD